jgi:hypothetical protein
VKAQETALAGLCRALDPDDIPLPDAEAVYDSLARMEKFVAGAKLRLARRVEEAGGWEREGAPSPAHQLARKTGTSVGQARTSLATSKKLTKLDDTDDAVRDGQLSTQQADAVADAASDAPEAEQRLLGAAKRQPLGELRDTCAKAKAAADRDGEERRKRIHAARLCLHRRTADGAGEILYRATPEATAEVWAVLQGHATRAFDQARLEGRHEPSEAYAADGMLAMARTAARATTKRSDVADTETESEAEARPVAAKVIVRVDHDALWRGHVADGETCEIAGVGPVAVSTVRDILAAGDVFLTAVVTRGVDVLNVAHLGRRPTAFQRTALEWRDPTCCVEGCNRLWSLQTDHRADWADTKITWLQFLDHLCRHHHDLKTHKGWALVTGKGKRAMVPPGDPRHPGPTTVDPPADLFADPAA